MPIVLPPRGSLLPARGSRARLPFLLIPVLAGMAVMQLAWPERIDLPPGGAVARVGVLALPDAPPVVIAPLPASRDLFAPPARRGISNAAGDPLDGAVIAGVMQQGLLRLGIVRQANGQVRYVGVGGAVGGWRLAALDQAAARLTDGPGQSLLVPYGMHASPLKNIGAPLASHAPELGNSGSPQAFERGQ